MRRDAVRAPRADRATDARRAAATRPLRPAARRARRRVRGERGPGVAARQGDEAGGLQPHGALEQPPGAHTPRQHAPSGVLCRARAHLRIRLCHRRRSAGGQELARGHRAARQQPVSQRLLTEAARHCRQRALREAERDQGAPFPAPTQPPGTGCASAHAAAGKPAPGRRPAQPGAARVRDAHGGPRARHTAEAGDAIVAAGWGPWSSTHTTQQRAAGPTIQIKAARRQKGAKEGCEGSKSATRQRRTRRKIERATNAFCSLVGAHVCSLSVFGLTRAAPSGSLCTLRSVNNPKLVTRAHSSLRAPLTRSLLQSRAA